jgi:hypothetical protein
MSNFYYVKANTDDESLAAEDAFTLIKAWEIRQDNTRLRAAANMLRQSHYTTKTVADLAQAESIGINAADLHHPR